MLPCNIFAFFIVLLFFTPLLIASESNSTKLQIDVKIPNTVLLYQQDLFIPVTLKNVSKSSILISVPPMDKRVPLIKLKNLSNNTETEYQRTLTRSTVTHELGRLLPGDKVDTGFNLYDVLPRLNPGNYEIRIGWFFNHVTNIVYSQAIKLNILPTTPEYLNVANAYGGRSNLLFGVWTTRNKITNRSDIIRSRFSLSISDKHSGDAVSHLIKVASCSHCKPVISTPAVGKVLGSQWIAWIEGRKLFYIHVDDDLGVSTKKSYPVSNDNTEIVSPIYSDEIVNTAIRPNGHVVLLGESSDKKSFTLQSLTINEKNISSSGKINLNGKKPLWIKNHVSSDQTMKIFYLQRDGKKLILHANELLGDKISNNKFVNLNIRLTKFLAANSIINSENMIYGASLLLGENKSVDEKLLLVAWSFSAGYFNLDYKSLDWSMNKKIQSANISIDDKGRPATLIKDEDGHWYVVDKFGHINQLPKIVEEHNQPMQLVFKDGDSDIFLLTAKSQHGFEILQQDGSPLPFAFVK